MKRISIAILALFVAMLMGACSDPFVIKDLGGKTFTYYMPIQLGGDGGFNGHDSTTLTFNEAGDGGTFESLGYGYGYPTAEAEAAAVYSGKTWFQDNGMRGSFTYDKDTSVATMTVTDMYGLKADATTEYQGDFEWKTLLKFMQDDMSPALTTASVSLTSTILITQDNISQAFFADGDNFVATQSMVQSFGSASGSMTMTQDMSMTLSFNATTITETTRDSVHQVMVVDGETETADEVSQYISTYRIDNAFEIGGTGTEFEKIWKPGKAVSFNVTRTQYTEIVDDTSDAAPTAPDPAVDPATGIGVNDPAGADFYGIDRNQMKLSLSFAREKDYIMYAYDLVDASRSVK